METIRKLPIEITQQVRDNPYIMSKLAQQAFELKQFDMSPDNAVEKALELGYIVVKQTGGTNPPAKIKRMTGNGSFA